LVASELTKVLLLLLLLLVLLLVHVVLLLPIFLIFFLFRFESLGWGCCLGPIILLMIVEAATRPNRAGKKEIVP
jgi:hypothetical protein